MNLWNIFEAEVRDRFAFLETDYAFKCVAAVPPFVTYQSELLRARVCFDERHEIDFGLERVDDDPVGMPSIGIGVIMRFAMAPKTEVFSSRFPSSADGIRREVQTLAAAVRSYGARLLAADGTAWARIRPSDTAPAAEDW